MSQSRPARAFEDESSLPPWFSPWGATALCCVALAVAQASLIGTRWLSIALSLFGASIVVFGAWRRQANRRPRDQVWFVISGGLCCSILMLIWLAPGILNSRWAIDKEDPKPDPNQMSVVPRTKAMEKGRPLSKDESVDAVAEAIRQDDVVALIDSVKIGQVAGKGTTAYLLVQFRVVNLGLGQSISLEGFAEHRPVLSDSAGRTFAFVDQRIKRIKERAVVFEDWSGRQSVEIPPNRGFQDVLLIFESPLTNDALQLEVPSTGWGRQGTCRFRIGGIDPSKS
jgi:hypothetical protein